MFLGRWVLDDAAGLRQTSCYVPAVISADTHAATGNFAHDPCLLSLPVETGGPTHLSRVHAGKAFWPYRQCHFEFWLNFFFQQWLMRHTHGIGIGKTGRFGRKGRGCRSDGFSSEVYISGYTAPTPSVGAPSGCCRAPESAWPAAAFLARCSAVHLLCPLHTSRRTVDPSSPAPRSPSRGSNAMDANFGTNSSSLRMENRLSVNVSAPRIISMWQVIVHLSTLHELGAMTCFSGNSVTC